MKNTDLMLRVAQTGRERVCYLIETFIHAKDGKVSIMLGKIGSGALEGEAALVIEIGDVRCAVTLSEAQGIVHGTQMLSVLLPGHDAQYQALAEMLGIGIDHYTDFLKGVSHGNRYLH